jgi:L-asparaginase II
VTSTTARARAGLDPRESGGPIGPSPLVSFTRGSIVESTHFGSIAVVDAEGRLVASAGDADRHTFMRSSAKPFQAMAFVESGAGQAFRVSPAELALVAASHSGEARHTEGVRGLLGRAGLGEDALLCGRHPPLDTATRAALERSGQASSAAHHNCSGKHCGMVCACVHQGWDLRTYVRPDHPLQRRILDLMAAVTAIPRERIAVAIDGCGVPTFGVPLRSFAHAFARLAKTESLPPEHVESAHTVCEAMVSNPGMVAGDGRLDTRLMEAAGTRILAKGGAEACHGVALMDRGWGIAIKIEDGGGRAVAIAVLEALRQLEALRSAELAQLEEFARPPVRNYRDEIVGEGRPVFELERA